MKQVIVFPRGQLSEKDRRAISRAGACVVEADDPSKVVSVIPVGAAVEGNEMLLAALESMNACKIDSPSKPFVAKLMELVRQKLSPG